MLQSLKTQNLTVQVTGRALKLEELNDLQLQAVSDRLTTLLDSNLDSIANQYGLQAYVNPLPKSQGGLIGTEYTDKFGVTFYYTKSDWLRDQFSEDKLYDIKREWRADLRDIDQIFRDRIVVGDFGRSHHKTRGELQHARENHRNGAQRIALKTAPESVRQAIEEKKEERKEVAQSFKENERVVGKPYVLDIPIPKNAWFVVESSRYYHDPVKIYMKVEKCTSDLQRKFSNASIRIIAYLKTISWMDRAMWFIAHFPEGSHCICDFPRKYRKYYSVECYDHFKTRFPELIRSCDAMTDSDLISWVRLMVGIGYKPLLLLVRAVLINFLNHYEKNGRRVHSLPFTELGEHRTRIVNSATDQVLVDWYSTITEKLAEKRELKDDNRMLRERVILRLQADSNSGWTVMQSVLDTATPGQEVPWTRWKNQWIDQNIHNRVTFEKFCLNIRSQGGVSDKRHDEEFLGGGALLTEKRARKGGKEDELLGRGSKDKRNDGKDKILSREEKLLLSRPLDGYSSHEITQRTSTPSGYRNKGILDFDPALAPVVLELEHLACFEGDLIILYKGILYLSNYKDRCALFGVIMLGLINYNSYYWRNHSNLLDMILVCDGTNYRYLLDGMPFDQSDNAEMGMYRQSLDSFMNIPVPSKISEIEAYLVKFKISNGSSLGSLSGVHVRDNIYHAVMHGLTLVQPAKVTQRCFMQCFDASDPVGVLVDRYRCIAGVDGSGPTSVNMTWLDEAKFVFTLLKYKKHAIITNYKGRYTVYYSSHPALFWLYFDKVVLLENSHFEPLDLVVLQGLKKAAQDLKAKSADGSSGPIVPPVLPPVVPVPPVVAPVIIPVPPVPLTTPVILDEPKKAVEAPIINLTHNFSSELSINPNYKYGSIAKCFISQRSDDSYLKSNSTHPYPWMQNILENCNQTGVFLECRLSGRSRCVDDEGSITVQGDLAFFHPNNGGPSHILAPLSPFEIDFGCQKVICNKNVIELIKGVYRCVSQSLTHKKYTIQNTLDAYRQFIISKHIRDSNTDLEYSTIYSKLGFSSLVLLFIGRMFGSNLINSIYDFKTPVKQEDLDNWINSDCLSFRNEGILEFLSNFISYSDMYVKVIDELPVGDGVTLIKVEYSKQVSPCYYRAPLISNGRFVRWIDFFRRVGSWYSTSSRIPNNVRRKINEWYSSISSTDFEKFGSIEKSLLRYLSACRLPYFSSYDVCAYVFELEFEHTKIMDLLDHKLDDSWFHHLFQGMRNNVSRVIYKDILPVAIFRYEYLESVLCGLGDGYLCQDEIYEKELLAVKEVPSISFFQPIGELVEACKDDIDVREVRPLYVPSYAEHYSALGPRVVLPNQLSLLWALCLRQGTPLVGPDSNVTSKVCKMVRGIDFGIPSNFKFINFDEYINSCLPKKRGMLIKGREFFMTRHVLIDSMEAIVKHDEKKPFTADLLDKPTFQRPRFIHNPHNSVKAIMGWVAYNFLHLFKTLPYYKLFDLDCNYPNPLIHGLNCTDIDREILKAAQMQTEEFYFISRDSSQHDAHQSSAVLKIDEIINRELWGILHHKFDFNRQQDKAITEVIRKKTVLVKVYSNMKKSKIRHCLFACSIKGTVYSGHPLRTTWGNSIRMLMISEYMRREYDLGPNFCSFVSGDDGLDIVPKSKLNNYLNGLKDLFYMPKVHPVKSDHGVGMVIKEIVINKNYFTFLSKIGLYNGNEVYLARIPSRCIQTGVRGRSDLITNSFSEYVNCIKYSLYNDVRCDLIMDMISPLPASFNKSVLAEMRRSYHEVGDQDIPLWYKNEIEAWLKYDRAVQYGHMLTSPTVDKPTGLVLDIMNNNVNSFDVTEDNLRAFELLNSLREEPIETKIIEQPLIDAIKSQDKFLCGKKKKKMMGVINPLLNEMSKVVIREADKQRPGSGALIRGGIDLVKSVAKKKKKKKNNKPVVANGSSTLVQRAHMCTQEYMELINYPILNRPTCLPWGNTNSSYKYSVRMSVTFSSGTAGYGFLAISPTICNNQFAVFTSGTTYAGTTLSTTSAGVGNNFIPTFFSSTSLISTWGGTSGEYGSAFRVVGVGLEIINETAPIYRAGDIWIGDTTNHSNPEGLAANSFIKYPNMVIRSCAGFDKDQMFIMPKDVTHNGYTNERLFNTSIGVTENFFWPWSDDKISGSSNDCGSPSIIAWINGANTTNPGVFRAIIVFYYEITGALVGASETESVFLSSDMGIVDLTYNEYRKMKSVRT